MVQCLPNFLETLGEPTFKAYECSRIDGHSTLEVLTTLTGREDDPPFPSTDHTPPKGLTTIFSPLLKSNLHPCQGHHMTAIFPPLLKLIRDLNWPALRVET